MKGEKLVDPNIDISSTDCSSNYINNLVFDPVSKNKVSYNLELKLSTHQSNDENESLNNSLHLPQINKKNYCNNCINNKHSKSLPDLVINTKSNHSNKDKGDDNIGNLSKGETIDINR